MRNKVLTVLLLVGSLSLGAFMGELVLRFLGYRGAPESFMKNVRLVDDPIINWRYVPGSIVQEGRVINAYNSMGFRDVEHKISKSSGMTRVIVLGDSVAEGGGVEWEHVFASILQAELGTNYEVINLAMGGLNTPQEIHLLAREGLQYRPDLVILNFVLNDCDFFTEYHAVQRYHAKKDSTVGLLNIGVNPEFKRFLKSSALIYFVKERLEDGLGRITGREETNYFQRIWTREDNRQKVVSGFEQLQFLQKQNGFQVVVIIWPLLVNYKDYSFRLIHEWVMEQATSRGFSSIDLLDRFAALSYRDLQVTAEDNVHPNGLGHKLGVEAFLEWHRMRRGVARIPGSPENDPGFGSTEHGPR